MNISSHDENCLFKPFFQAFWLPFQKTEAKILKQIDDPEFSITTTFLLTICLSHHYNTQKGHRSSLILEHKGHVVYLDLLLNTALISGS